jgi:hypothetical protein
MGQKQTKTPIQKMSALPPKADVKRQKADIGKFKESILSAAAQIALALS